ncbi:MAG TPA: adenosylmethionine--8-amino-7-oxononanoate transaminase [Polyangiaceae bacterium]|nr:adenosylmethionine--8-amino-7-oxononanoate transaminase [Polyangiaceae bacterium]
MSKRDSIIGLDKAHVWRPYTQMQDYLERDEPLVIQSARGSRLIDASGRQYLDGNASWWSVALGHQHPRLVAALKAQADELCHVALAGIAHEPSAALAAELCQVAPAGLSRVFFSDDGSTAVEVALKLALQYWAQNGRPARRRFLALEGAFHGETLGAASVSGIEVFRRPFGGVLLECLRVPPGASGYQQAFDVLGTLLSQQAGELAAVIVEPIVQGAAGMRIYAPDYLRALREVTRQHDVFLICDEVFTGYGRTGPFWASEHAGIAPDLLCTAKGFTAGMLPMAATLVSERIFDGFLGSSERTFFYGHTFCGNPLAAAVAREVLRVFRDEEVLSAALPKAQRIARAFEGFGSLPNVTATRSLGMLGALDLAGSTGYLESGGQRVYAEALRRGAYLRPLGNTVYITPSLNIPDADLDELLSIVEESVRAAGSAASVSP